MCLDSTKYLVSIDQDHKLFNLSPTKLQSDFYSIIDEILVNAADNYQRDKTMTCIKIEINQEENKISVWNNGKGIPIQIHKESKCYVPEMIFSQLLTSSNYNDEQRKVTGGRNGFGAKLANIFSTKFIIETADHKQRKLYR